MEVPRLPPARRTLVIPSLDRLGRSIQDLISIVSGLRKRGMGFQSLHESLDTTTSGGRLVFHVFAALAEFIRELIVQGTHEGLAAAGPRGARRPAASNDRGASAARAGPVPPIRRTRSLRSGSCPESRGPRSTSTCRSCRRPRFPRAGCAWCSPAGPR
ncbi:recombinase family protein [Streptomyces sp. NPDC006476]|uniref:recombinase family protein n=1 Tax=Streptomyces sp. NPDC006476 TaxID=3157175 RepID=UPI0033AC92D5